MKFARTLHTRICISNGVEKDFFNEINVDTMKEWKKEEKKEKQQNRSEGIRLSKWIAGNPTEVPGF